MTRAFTTATDSSLINLIQGARARLALIAPALTTPVARALAARMADLPALSLTVILDANAEVYRMGYGDPEALEIIRNASQVALFAGHVRSVRVVVDPPVFDDLARLSSGRLSPVLALEIAVIWRPAADCHGPAGADPADEHRERALGRTAHPRRTAQARL